MDFLIKNLKCHFIKKHSNVKKVIQLKKKFLQLIEKNKEISEKEKDSEATSDNFVENLEVESIEDELEDEY